ncbi:MAG: anti-sigma factor family protein [Eubacteriales bacterium]
MNCHECKYLMFDYVDDKLSSPVRLDMERHFEECSVCAEKLAKLKARQEEEKPIGMFWYLLRPSGGFKRFFFIGAIFTFILVLALISVQMKKPLFRFF